MKKLFLLFKLFLLLFLLLNTGIYLTGCSFFGSDSGIFQSHGKQYLKAKNIPPQKIPAGVSSAAIVSDYPIPARQDSEKAKDVNLIPPGLYDKTGVGQ